MKNIFRKLWPNVSLIMTCLQIYQKLLSLATFLRVHSILKEVSYLSWQNTYPNLKTTEAVFWRCSVEKVFIEVSQNSQENTCARVSFLIKLQASLQLYEKKSLWHRCFPVNFAKFRRTSFFTECKISHICCCGFNSLKSFINFSLPNLLKSLFYYLFFDFHFKSYIFNYQKVGKMATFSKITTGAKTLSIKLGFSCCGILVGRNIWGVNHCAVKNCMNSSTSLFFFKFQ